MSLPNLPIITTLPTAPNRKEPALFSARMDDFLGALQPYNGQLNALAAAIAQLGHEIAVLHDQAQDYRNEADHLANAVAAGHAASAAASAGAAEMERGLAAAERAGAAQERQQAGIARDSAQVFAEAAGASVGIAPSLAAIPLANLRINAAGDGLEATYSAPAGDMRRKSLSAAAALQATDKGALVDCAGTWTLGFAAAATLGVGWWCYVRNIGTGVITADPSGSELIDGVSSGVIHPSMALLIQCDGAAFHCVRMGPKVALQLLTSGTSWICPLGVRSVDVEIQGAGYGGPKGGGNSNWVYARPGTPGNGARAVVGTTPGAAIAYQVGAGGVGGVSGDGAPGGNTSFAGVTVNGVGSVTGATVVITPSQLPAIYSTLPWTGPSPMGAGSYGYGGAAGQSNPSGGFSGSTGGPGCISLRY